MTDRLQFLYDGGNLQIEFSKVETLTNVAKFDCYVEHGNKFTDYPSFEAKGYAILNYDYVQVSRWGSASITPELVKTKLNFVDYVTIANKLDELKTKVFLPQDKEPIDDLKQIFHNVYSTVDNGKLFDKLQATAEAKSVCNFEINGACLYYSTSNIQGSFNVNAFKLISPQELVLIEQFILERISMGDNWGAGLI